VSDDRWVSKQIRQMLVNRKFQYEYFRTSLCLDGADNSAYEPLTSERHFMHIDGMMIDPKRLGTSDILIALLLFLLYKRIYGGA
jgi:hypothetical protein